MASIETRLAGAPNFRDFGGAITRDGRRVRRGRLFRSEILSRATDTDIAVLRELNIAAVCDLRHGVERERQANRWPDDRPFLSIGTSPREGFDAAQGRDMPRRMAEPDFDLAEAKALLVFGYRRMPDVLAPSLRAIFDHLLDSGGGAVLVHCTSGKDRSGFVSAAILGALGAQPNAMFDDYLLSRDRFPIDHMRQMLQRSLGEHAPAGRLEALLEIASVHRDYLAAAFDEIEQSFGGFDRYLHDAAGLDTRRREQLRALLLEPLSPSLASTPERSA